MTAAAKFLEKVHRFERFVVFITFAVMTLVIIADVLSRKILGTGISGAARVAVYMMIITALISIGLASHTARHLRPKFADKWLPESWAPMMARIQEFVMAAFCIVFAVVAVGVVHETYLLAEESRMLRIPIWPMQSVIPFAFFIAAVRHGLYGIYPELKPVPAGAADQVTEEVSS